MNKYNSRMQANISKYMNPETRQDALRVAPATKSDVLDRFGARGQRSNVGAETRTAPTKGSAKVPLYVKTHGLPNFSTGQMTPEQIMEHFQDPQVQDALIQHLQDNSDMTPRRVPRAEGENAIVTHRDEYTRGNENPFEDARLAIKFQDPKGVHAKKMQQISSLEQQMLQLNNENRQGSQEVTAARDQNRRIQEGAAISSGKTLKPLIATDSKGVPQEVGALNIAQLGPNAEIDSTSVGREAAPLKQTHIQRMLNESRGRGGSEQVWQGNQQEPTDEQLKQIDVPDPETDDIINAILEGRTGQRQFNDSSVDPDAGFED